MKAIEEPKASKPLAPEPELTPQEIDRLVAMAQPKPQQPAPQAAPAPVQATVKAPEKVPAQVKAPEPVAPTKPPHVVEFKGVTKTYPGKKPYTAIKNVTFKVEDLPKIGEMVAILGPSGCGKSTVLKLIAGLSPQHPQTEGEVLVFGKPVFGPGADRGMVFQEYTSFDNRTVLDNVAFGLECRGMKRRERYEMAYDWIKKVGLNADRDALKYPHQLSGGMRQRVAIARSMILSPKILLMDEPFGALDSMTRLRMQDLLIKLWNNFETTVFFVTHSIEEAVFLGDRIYLFSTAPGTIIEEIHLPRPSEPAVDAQAKPEFADKVHHIRAKIAEMEKAKGIV
jgi:NitT/TauT family transport system ATP-binding protein